MNITRCPNCRTTLKVSAQQLSAYKGKVRCGKCASIFNAKACLEPAVAFPTSIKTAINTPAAVAPIPAPSAPTPAQSRSQSPRPKTHDFAQALARDEKTQKNPASYRPIPSLEDQALFLPIHRPSGWQRLWWVAVFLLGLLLCTQLLVYFSPALALYFPTARPYWLKLCAVFTCEVPLPRDAAQLRSDFSAFNYVPQRPHTIQMNATLRNLAPYAQALPMLELTLTDAQEHILVKKHFSATQYLTPAEQYKTSLSAHEELQIALQLDIGTLPAAGYALYWYYP